MSIIYPNPEDNMNKRTFFIQLSGIKSYQPLLPKYFLDNGMSPIYQGEEAWTNSVATPAIIVDLLFHSREFSFENNDDKKAVVEIIDSYIKKVQSFGPPNQKTKSYLDKCESAMKEIKESYNSWMNFMAAKYPDKYGRQESILDTITNKIRARFKL